MSQLITIIQSHDEIFKGVKIESSYLAKRWVDNQGNDNFDNLVFDEEYLILFRQLFFDARANVMSALSAYFKHLPEVTMYFDSQDATTNNDFIIQLLMPGHYLMAMNEPVNNKMKEFIIAHIMHRWLMPKLPNEAGIYLHQSETFMADMKRYLEMRTKPLRRKGRFI